ncbi:protein ACCELERATED CELL DEATH 6-like [Eucalyptus grandis]|uniref:protein ACCELERATED CELL DEATH 6-like n=1 Tax=Eucalyptus grandis TaxID=71139 RepID=UPI00192ECE63|nr:protein ACCELERATED CELL DEATH 6-like [Eucalyptus grandis]
MLTQDSVSCDETTTQELFTAAKQGDVDVFIRVVERYCSERNLRLCLRVILSPSRNPLLHVAAGLERDEILRAIVNHFPDQLVAGENCREDTALHLAARAGRVPTARVLISRASHFGGCNMRRTLVQVKNKRGNTPLHEAVVSGHLDVVRILIREDLQPTYWENKEGKCPVSLAVERGNVEVLRLLLAEPLDLSRIEGVSPVHAAVLHGKLDMLKEISERNPDLFGLKDDRGGTPLHLAAYIDYHDGIRFLREKFTSSTVEYDRDGHFPIHVACKQGHVQAIKELVRQWPDPMELINQHGQNILHVCTMHGRIEAVKYILGNADLEKLINEKDNDGNTPLHMATLPWHPVALLHLLLDKRVDLELVNNKCLTALDFAVEQTRRTDSRLQKVCTN